VLWRASAKPARCLLRISHEVPQVLFEELNLRPYAFDQTRDIRQNRASFMSEPNLRARIKEMLVKNLMLQVTPEQIGDDLPLFGANGLGLDSIDALELVVSMEKTFGVGVPSSEVAGKALQSVNTIHDYILEKRSAAA
jgi:acyl carrier protein